MVVVPLYACYKLIRLLAPAVEPSLVITATTLPSWGARASLLCCCCCCCMQMMNVRRIRDSAAQAPQVLAFLDKLKAKRAFHYTPKGSNDDWCVLLPWHHETVASGLGCKARPCAWSS
jgi:hypothetical protein